MTVPVLRDVEIRLPLNDAAVGRSQAVEVTAWTGRAGEAAELHVTVNELLPGGALGDAGGGVMLADPDHPGRYTRTLDELPPGGYYRLTLRASDPGVSADAVSQTYHFSTTPGTAPS